MIGRRGFISILGGGVIPAAGAGGWAPTRDPDAARAAWQMAGAMPMPTRGCAGCRGRCLPLASRSRQRREFFSGPIHPSRAAWALAYRSAGRSSKRTCDGSGWKKAILTGQNSVFPCRFLPCPHHQ